MTSDILLSVQDISDLKHMIGFDYKQVRKGKYMAWRNRYYCTAPVERFERLVRLNVCEKYKNNSNTVYYLSEYGFEVLGKILGVKMVKEE